MMVNSSLEKFGLSIVTSAFLVTSFCLPSIAGTAAVNNAEEGTTTGTVNFSPNSVNLEISLEQVFDLVQAIFAQIELAIAEPGFADSFEIQIITASPLTDSQTEFALQDIQVIQRQVNREESILRNRRPMSPSSDLDDIRAAIMTYGGTQETAALTTEIIHRLNIAKISDATLTIAELNLLVQGLGSQEYLGLNSQINRISPKRLLKSIEVFNTLVNQLTPAQLLIASQDPQLLAIKQLLEKMSEAIVITS